MAGPSASGPSERPPYLVARAGKRERSRRRVETLALEMFARDGFDAVTVEEICAEADIAPATFYRYFGSKEGVIFHYEEGFLAAAREIGAAVDATTPLVEQLTGMLRRCSSFFEDQSGIRMLRDEIVLADRALLQRTFYVERSFEQALAEALAAARQEVEPSAGTLLDAAVCLVVMRRALIAWRYQGDASLLGITNETLELLRDRLA